jgi:hypothetical protein
MGRTLVKEQRFRLKEFASYDVVKSADFQPGIGIRKRLWDSSTEPVGQLVDYSTTGAGTARMACGTCHGLSSLSCGGSSACGAD